MSQLRFLGDPIPITEASRSPINRSEKMVLSVFNGASELTYEDIHKRLRVPIEKGEIKETSNKARSLRSKGYLESFMGKDGLIRFRLTRRSLNVA
jgi:hypothetical protein